MQPIFVTGIGTGIGKTLISAILTEALQADYWKPVQAGYAGGTDSEWIKQLISNPISKIHPETYRLSMAASPHIAARNEGVGIGLDKIVKELLSIQGTRDKEQETRDKRQGEVPKIQNPKSNIQEERRAPYSSTIQADLSANDQRPTVNAHLPTANDYLIVEGAGGLLVPLNEQEFVIDLAEKLGAKIILVSRNYLGSINHSLLTASICRHRQLDVAGWIFNDQYLDYEEEIVRWSGFPKIASIPFCNNPGKQFVFEQAYSIKPALLEIL